MSFGPAHLLRTTPPIFLGHDAAEGDEAGPAFTVAIPANNEADDLPACLSALAMQRDGSGGPLPAGTFEVLLFANNCSDATAATARAIAKSLPFDLAVVEGRMPPERANAGFARKHAMDLAAERLARRASDFRAILTTDADSRVGPTWVGATLRAFAEGADCVAGYVDADPLGIVGLGPAFLMRGRLEDRYLSLIAEIEARCDPRPHDPWPNHRVSSGASLAVSLEAYQAIGGLPPLPLGEDAALTRRLDAAGFRVRHAMDVCVTTSCRFDGRAAGGAADTMRLRHATPDAPCDDDLEPALQAFRRARLRRALRHVSIGAGDRDRLATRLVLAPDRLAAEERNHEGRLADLWCALEAVSPSLARRGSLRPSDLPGEIVHAERILQWLRRPRKAQSVQPIDGIVQAHVVEPAVDGHIHE